MSLLLSGLAGVVIGVVAIWWLYQTVLDTEGTIRRALLYLMGSSAVYIVSIMVALLLAFQGVPIRADSTWLLLPVGVLLATVLWLKCAERWARIMPHLELTSEIEKKLRKQEED